VAVGVLAFTLELPLLLIALVFLVRTSHELSQLNFVFIMLLGRVVVRAILFPYSNSLIKNRLDGTLNQKFGAEFVKILNKAVGHLQSFLDTGEIRANSQMVPYFANSSITTTVELLNLYLQINEQVIELAKKDATVKCSPQLVKITDIFRRVIGEMKKLQLQVNSARRGKVESDVFTLYSGQADIADFEALMNAQSPPVIKGTKEHIASLNEL